MQSTLQLLRSELSVTPDMHRHLQDLIAAFYRKEISEEGWALLQVHMAYCDECHDIFRSSEGEGPEWA